MKLRPVPLIVTLVVSSGLLFGGWFAYQALAMKDPFLERVAALDGVVDADFAMERDRALVSVKLAEDANLRETVQELEKAARASLGSRRLAIEAEGVHGTNDRLESIWSVALFDVAEAMETGKYSNIPKVMKELSASGAPLVVLAEMDDENVYITLRDGEHAKYVVLPRRASVTGVWPNE